LLGPLGQDVAGSGAVAGFLGMDVFPAGFKLQADGGVVSGGWNFVFVHFEHFGEVFVDAAKVVLLVGGEVFENVNVFPCIDTGLGGLVFVGFPPTGKVFLA